MRTELCDRFGIEYPIFVFTPSEKVAAAVSKAGGLGVLGCVRFNDADDLEDVLQWMDANTLGLPYGVDVVMPAKVPTEGSAVDIDKLIPQGHRDFVTKTLADLGVPPLPDDEAPPQATHLAIGPDTDWTALTVWLSALLHARGDRIVRVKGVIAAPAGRLLLQGVRREVQRPEIMPASGQPDARDNLLVLIGRGYAPADLARSLAGFTRMRPPPTAPAITTK